MWLILAAVALLGSYVVCLAAVLAVRRRPLALAAPLAAALLVSLEAALLHGLTIVHGVTRLGVVAGNVLLMAAPLLLLPRLRAVRLRWPSPRRFLSAPAAVLQTFGLLALLSALLYRPNNGDSMVYHMARVAHWLQNASVAPYPTHIARQVAFPPGAEYLILVLQVISNSDRLANLVQFGAWVLIVCAASPLARLFGAEAKVARWGGFLAGVAPMALVQASSTQNDLLAASMGIAIVIACVPFLHLRDRWRAGDLVLLASAICAGYLVKPTGLVAAFPFCVWGALLAGRTLGQRATWHRLLRAWPAGLLAAGAIAPILYRRPDDSPGSSGFLYTGASDLGDRVLNVFRGILRDIPIPLDAFNRLAPEHTFACDQPHKLCLLSNLMLLNDDAVADPGQVIFLLTAGVLAVVLGRAAALRARLALGSVLVAWLIFHALIRDNVVLPRLQLPLIVLAPLGLAVWRERWLLRWPGALAARAFMVFLAAIGAMTLVTNGRRPLNPVKMMSGGDDEGYYRLEPGDVRTAHGSALKALEKSGCTRLGLLIRESSYDYPLTWRAMQRGIEVRHMLKAEEWPCAIFSDVGPPPRDQSTTWVPSEAPLLYVRAPLSGAQ